MSLQIPKRRLSAAFKEEMGCHIWLLKWIRSRRLCRPTRRSKKQFDCSGSRGRGIIAMDVAHTKS
jgi:hypothetical protein